jgi:AraC-like DNA-binding protein
VRSVFRLRGESDGLADLILPDVGSADVVIQFGEPSMLGRHATWSTSPSAYVLGQTDEPIETRYGRNVDLVGIRLGVGCACVLGYSGAELQRGMCALADMDRRSGTYAILSWAEAFVRGRSSIHQLAALIDGVACSCDKLSHEAARRLCREDVAVSAVCRDLGISRRHLTRRFNSAFGITPRALKRLARFSRAWRSVSLAPPRNWTEVALAAGYCDHAHLDRDFRAFAGAAPTALFSERWYGSFAVDHDDGQVKAAPATTS